MTTTPTTEIDLPAVRTPEYRFFEILPGLTSWSLLLLPVLLSIWFPWPVSIALLIYTLFWLYRSVRMTARLLLGYRRYRRAIRVDWLARCEALPAERRWRSLYHAVIVTVYTEPEPIVTATLEALVASAYPSDRIILSLAVEERAGPDAVATIHQLVGQYRSTFAHVIVSVHPDDQPGEVRGKGANITHAGRQLVPLLTAQGIDPADVMVTTLDADNRVHPKYLANLAYAVVTDPDPLHRSYQPLPMFFNNIWDVPLPIRSISVGSSFWQLTESMRPERLRNFSAHAQSLAALIATDFWSVRTIVEDGHQFWRTYFRFHGRHSVTPLWVPIYQDAVLSPKGYLASFRQQYIQKRRWAWGASDVAYVVTNLLNQPAIGWRGWVLAWRLFEGHISWAITSLMLAVVGWAPIYLNPAFRQTILALNYPLMYTRLLQLALVGLVVSFVISLLTLPPLPARKRTFQLSLILEWLTAPVLLPITNVLFGSFPAIEAQTRLMLGQYLEFTVTEKAPIREDPAALLAKH